MLKTFPKGGVHPEENKLSAGKAIEKLPLPEKAYIPVVQHIGAPTEILVNKGDKVLTGQLIAKSGGFVSANIHASVSGTVEKIDSLTDSSGYRKNMIIIQVEGDEWVDTIDKTPAIVKEIKDSAEDIIKKINGAGIVGLGGATFPSHVKLSIPPGKKADCLIINAVECEPYLTSDHSLMMEKSEEIMIGVQLLMKALQVTKAYIGIENNKPDAIKKLSDLAASFPGIEVNALKVKYPQGGEKQLIKAITNREVPSGGLPIDVGTVVFNVGTTFAVYEAVQKNKPLFERVVTVTGKSVSKPSNFWVRIGTPVAKLIEASGGSPNDTGKIINGGPMMGKAINTLDVPIVKGSSGILLMKQEESLRGKESNCIRCGKCLHICPMSLEPYLLIQLVQRDYTDKMEANKIMDCIECGSCSFTCPANLPLLDYIRSGKSKVLQIIKSRNK